MQPLTHHEILALVPPFTGRGRQVDLAASDRATRCLVFKPVWHALPEGTLEDTLRLEPFGDTRYRLTRQLTHPSGLQASLRAVSASLDELLAGIEAVAPQSQFRSGDGYTLALNQRLAAGIGGPQAQVVLLDGTARIGALTLTLTVPSVPGVPAEVNIAAAVAGARPGLPQDLLAVLGWDWARLIAHHQGWRSRLKLARKEPRRSPDAVAKLERGAAHIARTLAEPPRRFHDRYLGARWGVVLRRGIPVLTLVLLGLGLWVLSRHAAGRETGAWVLLIHVPTLMLAISFRLQELAQFEIPPLPRPPPAAAWPVP
jgi:hypothetical protein